MRAFLGLLTCLVVAVLAVFVGWRITQLSDDAFGMLLMAGCLSPLVAAALLALVYSMARRDRMAIVEPEKRPQLPAPGQYPPVIVVGGGQQPYPYQAALPPPGGSRQFEVVGDEDGHYE